MSNLCLVVLFAVSAGMGQLLFKHVAQRQLAYTEADLMWRLWYLMTDWMFVSGVFFYAFLLIFWIWLLTFTPLSLAYPFTLLSVIVATVGGAYFFHEPFSMMKAVALTIIGVGLILLSMAKA